MRVLLAVVCLLAARPALAQIRLNEIVVTGVAGLMTRRAQAAAIETITLAELERLLSLGSLSNALQGRATGLDLTPSSGSSGQAQTIRLRGGTSIVLSNEPLVFIDGVRVDTRIQANNANGGQASSRWFDLDPAHIERIEIARGPAAASLYGADASAGVIQIFTRRPVASSGRFSQKLDAEIGSLLPNWTPPANYARCAAADVRPDSPARLCHGLQPGALIRDNPLQRDDVLRRGRIGAIRWQAQGGSDQMGVQLALGAEKETGTLPQNAFDRSSGRLALRWQPAADWTIDASVSMLRSKTALPQNGDNPAGLLAALLGNPLTVGGSRNGWPDAPAQAIAAVEQVNHVLRFIPVLNLAHAHRRIDQRLIVGFDATNSTGIQFVPRLEGAFGGVWANGLIGEDQVTHRIYTVDYLGNLKLRSAGAWSSTVSLGLQYAETAQDLVSALGFGLATNDARQVSNAAERTGSQNATRNRAFGVLGHLHVAQGDRLFAQLGVRADRNSAFGHEASAALFPKVGISYVALENPDAGAPLNALRLRAAFGTSGRAPPQNEAGATYSPAPYLTELGQLRPGVIPRSPGNANLEPERGSELEAGFDLSLLGNTLTAELSYFDKRSRDVLLRAPLRPSTGFREDPYANIGALRNRGVEATLSYRTTTLRLSSLSNRLTDLGSIAPFSGFGRFIVGRPLGALYSYRVLAVDTAAGRALVSDTTEYMGNPLPRWMASATTRFRIFGLVEIHTLVDGKAGYVQANITEDLRDRYYGSSERRARAAEAPAGARLRRFGPFAKADGTPVSAIAVVEPYIQDAAFLRWRELGATIDLPRRLSLTLTARNLALWTRYDGDPENVSYIAESGSGGANQYAQPNVLTMPQPQRWILRLGSRF